MNDKAKALLNRFLGSLQEPQDIEETKAALEELDESEAEAKERDALVERQAKRLRASILTASVKSDPRDDEGAPNVPRDWDEILEENAKGK